MKFRRDYDFYVYILSNYQKSCFYVGLTNDIIRRLIEHKNEFGSDFTTKYKLKELLYFEHYQYIDDAINREKEIKKWRRNKKKDLITSTNQNFHDLSQQLFDSFGITKEEIEEHSRYLKDKYKK